MSALPHSAQPLARTFPGWRVPPAYPGHVLASPLPDQTRCYNRATASRGNTVSNVSPQLASQLSSAQLELLKGASGVSAELGVRLFLVGGTVRDILAGNRPADLDVVAVGPPPEYAQTLAERLGGQVVAHSQFRTYKLTVGTVGLDLASARSETYAHPGALPAVAPGSIDDDLARRDFSINAMAVSLDERSWGDLLDPHRAREDIESGVIRILHPGSFVDDATRLLRAARYAGRMGFRLDSRTEQLLKRDMVHLDDISGDRVRHELERILGEPKAPQILQAAQELGVLAAIHPALAADETVLSKTRNTPDETDSERDLVLLAGLVFASTASQRAGLSERLNLAGRWARVVEDVGKVKAAFERLRAPGLRPSQIFDLLRDLAPASIKGCAIATDEPPVGEHLELFLSELLHTRPLLNGDDLLALGVPEGPMVGELLEKIRTARLEGLLSTRGDEETLVVRSLEDARPGGTRPET